MSAAPTTAPSFRRFGMLAAAGSALLGLAGLAQWVLAAGAALLPSGATPMKANTGLCLTLFGVAVFGSHRAPGARATRWLNRGAVTLCIVVGSLTLFEYAAGVDLGIDWIILGFNEPVVGGPSGRMSVIAALALIAVSTAFVFRDMETRSGGSPTQVLCFGVLVVMLVAFFGHVVGARSLFGAGGQFPGMGTETLAAFSLLTGSVLALNPERGAIATFTAEGVAGREARTALIMLGPMAIAVMSVVFLGQRSGWYDPVTATACAFALAVVLGVTACWRSFHQLVHAEHVIRAAVSDARSSEAQFRIAFEAAPSGMLMVDEAGVIALANGRAEALFGFAPGELDGQAIEALVPEGWLAAAEADHEVTGNPGPLALGREPTVTARRNDGAEFPAEICVKPVMTAEGKRLLVTVMDISARRRSEEAIGRLNADLRASEGRFALAVRGSHDGIWDWDAKRKRLWCSLRVYEQCGWNADRHPSLYKHWLSRLHPEDRGPAVAALRAHLRRDAPFDAEFRIRNDEGAYRWFRARGEAVFGTEGEPLRMAGSLTDVTELKQNLHWLRESERRLRVALDNHRVGLWQWHLPTDEVRCDANWRSVHDWSAGKDSPTREEWLAAIHPDDRSAFIASLRDCDQDPSHTFEVEYRTRTASGRIAWICTRGRVVQCGADGRPTRLMGTVEGITEWKRVESLLEARNRELENLLYVTSHDLREPLRAVLGFSKIVEEHYQRQLDAAGRDCLARVTRAANRLDRLLGEIWTLSRVRRIERPSAPVELRELVRNAVSQLDERIRETGAKVEIRDGFTSLPVHPTWVTQAIYNLVLNSLKFVRPGESPHIEVAPWQNGDAALGVVVRDRGPGVAPEHAERIFRLFQRAVGREVEGTGAGLAIVREVAERHGGRAWVQSRAGGGSEFIMTFGDSAGYRELQ